MKQEGVLLDNTKKLPVLYIEATIVTSEGIIKYKYINDSLKKLTLDTEQTSGLFTKGTITRTYLEEDNIQQIRKLVYRSDE